MAEKTMRVSLPLTGRTFVVHLSQKENMGRVVEEATGRLYYEIAGVNAMPLPILHREVLKAVRFVASFEKTKESFKEVGIKPLFLEEKELRSGSAPKLEAKEKEPAPSWAKGWVPAKKK